MLREKYIELINKVNSDPYRLHFHLMAPTGWLNDPNGLCVIKGVNHIYFQYTPFSATWGLKSWGHYSTENWIDYTEHPIFLRPSVAEDIDGVYSGSTLVENNVDPEQLLTICHRIGNGEAFSKQGESMCLLSALGKLCPYDDRQHCVGCQYELQTKSTLLLLIGEFNRLNKQYQKLKNELERGKVRAILEKQIKPCLTEMLQALSEQYGEAVLSDYEDIIKELVS